jgi:hypothetical protein
MKQEPTTTLDNGIQQQKQFIDTSKGKNNNFFLKVLYFILFF